MTFEDLLLDEGPLPEPLDEVVTSPYGEVVSCSVSAACSSR